MWSSKWMSVLLMFLASIMTEASQLSGCPDGCSCDVSRQSVVCVGLQTPPMWMPFEARSILVADGHFDELPSGMFRDLPRLQHIALQNIVVGRIRKHAFQRLTGDIDDTVFSMTNFRADVIEKDAIVSVHKFFRVIVHNFTVGTLETKAFHDFNKIGTFEMHSVSFANLHRRAFANFRDIGTIGFNSWNVSRLDSDVFFNFRDVDRVTFSTSYLGTISSRFLHVRHVRSIILHGLDIDELKTSAFAAIGHVSRFSIYSSVIRAAENDVFNGMHSLVNFAMFRTTLSELPPGFFPTKVDSIRFYSNRVDTILCGVFDQYTSTVNSFHVSNNLVTCDCRLQWLQYLTREAIDIIWDGFTCSGPEQVKDHPLTSFFTILNEQLPCNGDVSEIANCATIANNNLTTHAQLSSMRLTTLSTAAKPPSTNATTTIATAAATTTNHTTTTTPTTPTTTTTTTTTTVTTTTPAYITAEARTVGSKKSRTSIETLDLHETVGTTPTTTETTTATTIPSSSTSRSSTDGLMRRVVTMYDSPQPGATVNSSVSCLMNVSLIVVAYILQRNLVCYIFS